MMVRDGQPAAMVEIDAPAIRSGTWLSALIERQEIAGSRLFSVTVRSGIGRVRRRWFPSHVEARCFALDQADALGLPLIDMSGGEGAD